MPYALIEGFEDEATATHLSFSAADTSFSEVAGEGSRGFALQRDNATDGNVTHTEGVTSFGTVITMAFGLRIYRPSSSSGAGSALLQAQYSGTSRSAGLGLTPSTGNIFDNSDNNSDPTPGISYTLATDQWTYIEMVLWYVSGTTSIDYEFYANGALVQSGAGGTAGFGADVWSGAFDNFSFAIDADAAGYRFDDLYCWVDTTASTKPPTVSGVSFPFGKRLHVDRLLPDATGALTDWGGAYTDVDDDDPTTSTGTSVSSTTSTDQASYSVAARPEVAEAILAVQYDVWGQGNTNIEPLWRSSGGSVGTDTTDVLALPASWGGARVILDENPQTATDWTPSDVSTGEFGFELE